MNSPETNVSLQDAQQALKEGKFETGLHTAEAIIASQPENSEALYLGAVAARFLKNYDKAEQLLAELHHAAPEYGRAWQESGHLARDRGHRDAAIAAYARACQFNPALLASWKGQIDLLRQAGLLPQAEAAAEQAKRVQQLPRELLAALNHLHEGRLAKAEDLCRYYLQQHPRDVEGMRLLAEIGSRFGVLDDAEFLLESALTFKPDDLRLRLDYIQVLRSRQKFAEAYDQAAQLYEAQPDNVTFQSQLAIESMQTGKYERAFELFDAVLERLPNDPATLTSRGHALKTYGKQADAVASYQAAIAARPAAGEAYYSLANLKTYRFSDAEIEAMHAQLDHGDLSFMDRVHLNFALGKAHEDAGEYERSFRYYDEGNALKRRQSRYDADQMRAEFDAQMRVCTSDLFAAQAGKGHDAADPIFVLGLPRAGSTLIEQILASHSQVDGTMELPDILAMAHRLRGRSKASANSRYPGVLAGLSADQLQAMGRQYIENTRIHRQGAPFFIDKMPNNFRHIGLIQLILPNARIIDARRAPMDCCFSGFKQLFAQGQEFTYGLTEIGRYYSDYVDLMDHWDRALPQGRILRVQHEDVLDDLEGQVRRILDYCGLPFEESCVEFHKTDRAVRTASSEQVRQPINRSGVAAWKPFDAWLAPLKQELGVNFQETAPK
ncbi:tetratricopeptide repeat-containing sulfotransferase family protein [Altericroceibacterium endophyticum]|uniref:Tetratricopeptide repeat protein n=1 Tax=Altericroceibacterium endophyticum TaxID=1808508 RepID=A0A6I4T6D5_9SPHN|nr:tetratricopeptide repeat-containing sulfotransferase family protein [Altericroceibacterium endophyticum]MXO66764.1 tetratricopeptide repeat protein [Altericroceibacterium endophyticum]